MSTLCRLSRSTSLPRGASSWAHLSIAPFAVMSWLGAAPVMQFSSRPSCGEGRRGACRNKGFVYGSASARSLPRVGTRRRSRRSSSRASGHGGHAFARGPRGRAGAIGLPSGRLRPAPSGGSWIRWRPDPARPPARSYADWLGDARPPAPPDRPVRLVSESGKTIAHTAESNGERMAAVLEPRHGPLRVVPPSARGAQSA